MKGEIWTWALNPISCLPHIILHYMMNDGSIGQGLNGKWLGRVSLTTLEANIRNNSFALSVMLVAVMAGSPNPLQPKMYNNKV